MSANDLDTIHRIPSRVENKPRPIVVRFTHRWKKEALLKKKPRLNSADIGLPALNLKITLSHHLTPFQRELIRKNIATKKPVGRCGCWCRCLARSREDIH